MQYYSDHECHCALMQ